MLLADYKDALPTKRTIGKGPKKKDAGTNSAGKYATTAVRHLSATIAGVLSL
ncbi:MAG TPA: hypothetical protein PLR18_01985 [bacterium]|nr:hypothetical protein [bacterium]